MAVSSEEQERVRSDLRRYLERLRSSDMRTRDQASDALSDFFEYDIGNSYKIDRGRLAAFQREICEAMEALIGLAVSEQNAVVIESALHALVSAVVHADGARLVTWDPLVVNLGKFNEVEYVLSCLSHTGDPKYRPVIAQFLQHASEATRVHATEQLESLDREINIAAGQDACASGLSETQTLEQAEKRLPRFQPGYVVFGYYVQSGEMGDRNSSGWQIYRAALRRLGLQDHFDLGTQSSG